MNDYEKMATIYEAFIGDTSQKYGAGMPGGIPREDRKNRFTAGGINNPGFVDNGYALGVSANNSAIEDEEESTPAAKAFKEFCNELRGRGQDRIANELALLVKKFL
jgi:hypothetical protein